MLDAEWYWFRIEYQHRGVPHIHGFVKMKNDPGIQTFAKTALKGYLMQCNTSENILEQYKDEVIQQGELGEKKIINYCEGIINLENNKDIIDPVVGVHPCKIAFKDVQKEDYDYDYYEMINKTQRHTNVSSTHV